MKCTNAPTVLILNTWIISSSNHPRNTTWEIHVVLSSPNLTRSHTGSVPFDTLVLSFGIFCHTRWKIPFQWRHNDHDSVSNHQPHGCLLNRLFRRRSMKTSKLRVTGLWVGNSPGPVNSPHKGPVTRKMFPFDDVIMQKTLMYSKITSRDGATVKRVLCLRCFEITDCATSSLPLFVYPLYSTTYHSGFIHEYIQLSFLSVAIHHVFLLSFMYMFKFFVPFLVYRY